jgi:hypothetical protein
LHKGRRGKETSPHSAIAQGGRPCAPAAQGQSSRPAGTLLAAMGEGWHHEERDREGGRPCCPGSAPATVEEEPTRPPRAGAPAREAEPARLRERRRRAGGGPEERDAGRLGCRLRRDTLAERVAAKCSRLCAYRWSGYSSPLHAHNENAARVAEAAGVGLGRSSHGLRAETTTIRHGDSVLVCTYSHRRTIFAVRPRLPPFLLWPIAL